MTKKSKGKFYVVWLGWKIGVFDNWVECQSATNGYPNNDYKGFPTRQEAEDAYYFRKEGSQKLIIQDNPESEITNPANIYDFSISVDGACNGSTWECEFQGVDTNTKKQLFHGGIYRDGTNNLVEFLGIVHGLMYCQTNKLTVPIYSDSTVAIGWVDKKMYSTTRHRSNENSKLFEALDNAILWLKTNKYTNPIMKWETKDWGENPADFGRK